MTKSRPAPVIPSPTTLIVRPAEGPSDEVVEDSKEGIVSSVRRAMAKWKVFQAIGEPSPGDGSSQIRRRVMQRRGFARLMSSISSDPDVMVVIPDDDV